MIKKLILIIFLQQCSGLLAFAQNGREQDFSLWYWLQVEKKLGKKQYAEFQYQVRFKDNASRFARSNIYFIYGRNLFPFLQVEGLYQLNTNHKADQHTLFIGLTYKQRIVRRFSAFYRTSFQATRNYFTGDLAADKPFFEWRNRIRGIYRINNLFSCTLSAEPYVRFSYSRPAYLSRIRFVAQFNYRYNKYQSCSLFFLTQPDVVSYSRPETDYALGITYHFSIPAKAKAIKKIIQPKSFKRDKGNHAVEIFEDTYN